jgi:tetratricopeptide (TPR) repeat protein
VLESRLGHKQAAAKLFKQAAQLFPSHAPVYAAWATFEWQRGNFRAAKRVYQQAEEKAPPHAPLLSAHARCARPESVACWAWDSLWLDYGIWLLRMPTWLWC